MSDIRVLSVGALLGASVLSAAPIAAQLAYSLLPTSPVEEEEARQVCGAAGLGVVAGNQSPQPAIDDQRDRHRRVGAHVAHVLQVNR